MQGLKVAFWRAAMGVFTLLAWVLHFPLRFVAWLSTLAHGAADAAEIEWLLAQAWSRHLAQLAVQRSDREGRCPVAGVCMGRGDCRDHACPGRGGRR